MSNGKKMINNLFKNCLIKRSKYFSTGQLQTAFQGSCANPETIKLDLRLQIMPLA